MRAVFMVEKAYLIIFSVHKIFVKMIDKAFTEKIKIHSHL